MNDLVSIVIPCYNDEQYVCDAIASAREQTYQNVEIIVVDDGSTDASCERVSEIDDSRVKLIRSENHGACHARNLGLARACGDYIQFLDADDLLDPEKISIQLDLLKKHVHSLVYCWHRIVDFEGLADPFQWNRKDDPSDPVAFMLRQDLPTPAPLHRKEVLEKTGGWLDSMPCAQDREFHLRLAMAGVSFIPCQEVLYTIRKRSGSLGTSDVSRVSEERAKLALLTAEALKREGKFTALRAELCAVMLIRAARVLRATKMDLAKMYMREAETIFPNISGELYTRPVQKLASVVGIHATEWLRAKWSKLLKK